MRTSQLVLVFSVVLVSAYGSLCSGQNQERLIQAHRLSADEKILLDGRLEEALWERIPPTGGFLQQEPVEGAVPTEETEIRIAYDSNNLYIGVMAYDSDPDGILAYQRQRDAGLSTDDRFMWIIDTFGDGRTAYYFEINPAGLLGDGLLRVGQGGGLNKSWDGIWNVRTSWGPYGWSAEIVIPFRTLNFDPNLGAWGINFQRTVRRKNEETVWSGFRRNQGIFRPQNAGTLVGLEGISQGIGVEVKPYGVASWRRSLDETRLPYDAGFDVTYSLTTNLRASVTINTDFAEAEVDQRRVNLTRFPLQFPERRDFFLEGSSVFSFAPASGINPYFSRRIGLVEGQTIPILAGARLAGQTGPYDIGFLHVRTDEIPGIPSEDFTVGRVVRNVFAESTVGILYTRRATAALSGQETLDDRHTLGSDFEFSTTRFLGDQNLQFQAFYVWHNSGLPADTTTWWDRSARGVRLSFPNQPFSGHVSYREFGSHFSPAVGFTPRRAFRRVQPTINYSPILERSSWIRSLNFSYYFEYLMDLDFRPETVFTQVTPLEVRFESGDGAAIDVSRRFERLPFAFDILRDETIVIPPGDYSGWGWSVGAESAGYRRVSVEGQFSREAFWSGMRNEISSGLTLRPLVGVSMSGFWSHSAVALAEGSFSSHLVRLSGNIGFSPFIYLIANIQYDNLSEIVGVFSRLRWTIRPGSDLYLVYTHNWLNTPIELISLERGIATKVTYSFWF